MTPNTPLIRPTDDQAISQAKSLIFGAKYGSLAFTHPQTGTPFVTRIALGTTPEGILISLVSDLSLHTQALQQAPDCALLVGEPKAKGDPLTHPRLSLQCRAEFLPRTHENFQKIRDHHLKNSPKSKLYIDFADFKFVVFHLTAAAMNGGFGKAYQFSPGDLHPT